MKLTIIYHLYNNSENLKESLNSILNQTSQDFSIIFIADQANEKVRSFLKEIDLLKKIKNFKFITISQNLGHSYCFNFALKYVTTPYVYFASSSVTLDRDFIDTIYKSIEDQKPIDVLFFNIHNKQYKTIDATLNKETFLSNLYLAFYHTYTNKVFNVDFLIKNNIYFANFKHFTTLFLYVVFAKAKTWELIDKQIATLCFSTTKNFNTYDLIDQFSAMIAKYSNDDFYQRYKADIEYTIIRTLLVSFLHDVWVRTCHNKKTFTIACEYTEKWLNTYIPNWKKNTILNSDSNADSKVLVNYMKKFEFKPKNIIKNFATIEKEM